jgi:octanoyl-[GcvH]:protein N-octanoyltransferase
MFDENALAITLIMPHETPHTHTIKRYDVFSNIIAGALKALGIDARVGELPNEYCPGKYSINANDKVKLVGIAQRMNRHCVQMGAIIAVNPSEKVPSAIAEAYGAMGLSFDPATYGSVTGLVPSITYEQVQREVHRALLGHLSSAN